MKVSIAKSCISKRTKKSSAWIATEYGKWSNHLVLKFNRCKYSANIGEILYLQAGQRWKIMHWLPWAETQSSWSGEGQPCPSKGWVWTPRPWSSEFHLTWSLAAKVYQAHVAGAGLLQGASLKVEKARGRLWVLVAPRQISLQGRPDSSECNYFGPQNTDTTNLGSSSQRCRGFCTGLEDRIGWAENFIWRL